MRVDNQALMAELADAKKETANDWLNNQSCQERIRHKV